MPNNAKLNEYWTCHAVNASVASVVKMVVIKNTAQSLLVSIINY